MLMTHRLDLDFGIESSRTHWLGVALQEIYILLRSAWWLLEHSYPLWKFSLAYMWHDDDQPGAQWFFFSFRKFCQSEASSNLSVGGPSSSHFQKVPLKTTWGCRGKTFLFNTNDMFWQSCISMVVNMPEGKYLVTCGAHSSSAHIDTRNSACRRCTVTCNWGRESVN